MKKLLMALLLLISSGCSAMPLEDVLDSPASLNQRRMIINDEVGFVSNTESITVKGITSGTFSIRGKGNCGYYDGVSYDSPNINYSLKDLPNYNNCLYDLELRDNSLDAPIIGQLFFRKFDNPNVMPLDLTVNNVPRSGVNWVQMAEENSSKGITEDRWVFLYPKGSSGTVYISGCGVKLSYQFSRVFIFNIRDIYPIDRDCMFDILVNNNDYLKENASLFVGVYKQNGGFLPSPIAYKGRFGRQCFEFQDPYVGYVIVNDRRTYGSSGCGLTAEKYNVIGVTSKGRLFFGEYANGSWTWVR